MRGRVGRAIGTERVVESHPEYVILPPNPPTDALGDKGAGWPLLEDLDVAAVEPECLRPSRFVLPDLDEGDAPTVREPTLGKLPEEDPSC
jgi:hypothetical protein